MRIHFALMYLVLNNHIRLLWIVKIINDKLIFCIIGKTFGHPFIARLFIGRPLIRLLLEQHFTVILDGYYWCFGLIITINCIFKCNCIV